MSGFDPDNYSMFEKGYEPENLTTSYGTGYSGVSGSGVARSALMSGGNPALMAGLVGLQILEANKQRKQRNKEMEYQAKLSQQNRTTAALSQMADLGSALGL